MIAKGFTPLYDAKVFVIMGNTFPCPSCRRGFAAVGYHRVH
jgi:hypothetical protein